MKGKGFIKLAATVAVIAAAVLIAVYGVGESKSMSAANIKLGLDLAGGVSITYQTVIDNPTASELDDTVYKMQKRAESFSTEAQVYPEGDNRVTVSIPDVTDADEVLAGLGSAGNIYFVYGMSTNDIQNIERYYDSESGEYQYMLTRSMDEIIADGDVVIDGADVANAEANIYQNELSAKEYIVELTLNETGRTKFAEGTEYCYKYYNSTTDEGFYRNIIAIVYDGEVTSAPCVASVIDGGTATISGQESYEEAKRLATTIRIGALPLELSVLRYYVEGAQLGSDALESSLIAGAIGFAIIVIFMIAVYRIPGVAASLALVLYVALMVVSLNLFGVTLTLPGIAGIILSIGMAVDANVIIFTRIKEELGTGKTVRSSLKLGFSKALSAIIDGNVTTIIAAIVLYFLGSGTVKGFAQTLAIGIVLSMITALFVTKFILNAMYEAGASKVAMYGTKKEGRTLHIVENFRRFVCIPAVLLAVGIIAIIINVSKIGTPFNYGLDFSGGTATTVAFENGYPEDIQSELEQLVEATIGMRAEISLIADEDSVQIKTKELSTEDRALLADALKSTYGISDEVITTESVGAAVSGEMKKDALVAVIVATIGMLLYIWLRFKNFNFATSAVLALMHDVLMVLVLYAVGRSFVSVGNTFIACMLTIVGYSINATIVIFDRIRENIAERISQNSMLEIVNISITQTLSRSINTSFTTFITVFILAIMGVRSVQEFSIPLIVGIVCGTFSSVCLTGGLWFNLQKRFNTDAENSNP